MDLSSSDPKDNDTIRCCKWKYVIYDNLELLLTLPNINKIIYAHDETRLVGYIHLNGKFMTGKIRTLLNNPLELTPIIGTNVTITSYDKMLCKEKPGYKSILVGAKIYDKDGTHDYVIRKRIKKCERKKTYVLRIYNYTPVNLCNFIMLKNLHYLAMRLGNSKKGDYADVWLTFHGKVYEDCIKREMQGDIKFLPFENIFQRHEFKRFMITQRHSIQILTHDYKKEHIHEITSLLILMMLDRYQRNQFTEQGFQNTITGLMNRIREIHADSVTRETNSYYSPYQPNDEAKVLYVNELYGFKYKDYSKSVIKNNPLALDSSMENFRKIVDNRYIEAKNLGKRYDPETRDFVDGIPEFVKPIDTSKELMELEARMRKRRMELGLLDLI